MAILIPYLTVVMPLKLIFNFHVESYLIFPGKGAGQLKKTHPLWS